MRQQSRRFKLGASLLVLVIFLAVGETLVRLIRVDTYFQNRFFTLNRALDYPDVFAKDKDLFWRFRPDQTITSRFFEGRTFTINSRGLRGGEIAGIKSAQRLITLGNSCTFGWRLPDQLIYPNRLQARLGPEYEVVNAGIPGYSSLQGRRFFERDLVALQPNIVTILFAWNDHWAAAGAIADKDQQPPPGTILAVQNLLSRFHLYRLAKKLLLSLIEAHPESLFDPGAVVYRVGPEDFYANLAAICRTAREHGARPLLLTSPIPALDTYYPLGARSPMHTYHELYNSLIRQVAVDEDVALVDLARKFDEAGDLWDDAPNDPIHFNEKGHLLAAELIAEYVGNNPPAADSLP
jgi:lysophospholipase L1-like esterase